jgi:hypothetical protein
MQPREVELDALLDHAFTGHADAVAALPQFGSAGIDAEH